MLIVDAHCDTLTKTQTLGRSLLTNDLGVDLKRLSAAAPQLSVFAVCLEEYFSRAEWNRPESNFSKAFNYIENFYKLLAQAGSDVDVCFTAQDISRKISESRSGIILSVEGGESISGSVEALEILFLAGVRILTLTWNFKNQIACGVKDAKSDDGLSGFGREVLAAMKRLGMLADLSHLAEKSFYDVIGEGSAAVFASHSNFKTLCPHIRNLTDQQAVAIKDAGGVVCVCIYPYFLNGTENASIDDIIRHIEYGAALLGCDHLGIGTDFDGIDAKPAGVNGIQDLNKIFEALAKLNYLQDDIEKVAGRNLSNLFMKVLK